MASPAVILMNAFPAIIHVIKMLSVPILSVRISVLVRMGTMVMDISAITSMIMLQTLTTVTSVLEFAKTTLVLSRVHVKLEQPVTGLNALILMNVLKVLIRL